jgi:hypothetical protein
MESDWHLWTINTQTDGIFEIRFQTSDNSVAINLIENETMDVKEPLPKLYDSNHEITIDSWGEKKGIFITSNLKTNDAGFQTCFITLDQRVLNDFKEYIQRDQFSNHTFEVDHNDRDTINSNLDPSNNENLNSANQVNDPVKLHTSEYGNSIRNSETKDPTQGGGKLRKKQRTRRHSKSKAHRKTRKY